MRIIRVFPRKTNATPCDALVEFGPPTLFSEADEIHISVCFTWDMKRAEILEKAWSPVAKTRMGGPAYMEPDGEFIPGIYLKHGYTITSRGCPNRCWFCRAWRKSPQIKELPIRPGNNLQDDNLLACSDRHIQNVFKMLEGQKKIQFTGGLEAARLKNWHLEAMKKLKILQMFFAYDTEDDYEPLRAAGKMLNEYGYTIKSRVPRAYVLIGYRNDSFDAAEKRLHDTMKIGFIPMAMLYKDESGENSLEWRRFQRSWARPAAIFGVIKSNAASEEER